MKKHVLMSALLASAALVGCSNGGTVVRTPDQYKADMTAAVQTKIPQLRACYETSVKEGDVKGKATLHFKIQTYFASTSGALFAKGELGDPKQGSTSVPKSEGSSTKLNKCVHDVISKIVLDPLDKKFGTGDWTLVFDPEVVDATMAKAP